MRPCQAWIAAAALVGGSAAWGDEPPEPETDRRWSVAMEPALQAVAVSRGGLHLDVVLELALGTWIGWQVVLPLLPIPAFILTPAVGLGYDSWHQFQPWLSLAFGIAG